jgi:hypothetical protein
VTIHDHLNMYATDVPSGYPAIFAIALVTCWLAPPQAAL